MMGDESCPAESRWDGVYEPRLGFTWARIAGDDPHASCELAAAGFRPTCYMLLAALPRNLPWHDQVALGADLALFFSGLSFLCLTLQ